MEYYDIDLDLIPTDTRLRDNITEIGKSISDFHDGLLYSYFIADLVKLTGLEKVEVEEAVWHLINSRFTLTGDYRVILRVT